MFHPARYASLRGNDAESPIGHLEKETLLRPHATKIGDVRSDEIERRIACDDMRKEAAVGQRIAQVRDVRDDPVRDCPRRPSWRKEYDTPRSFP
jgi:hypothetical protein